MSFEQPIMPPVPAELIREDIVRVKDCMLFSSGDYQVYLLRAAQASDVLWWRAEAWGTAAAPLPQRINMPV